jgi:methylmalonic aciduria homocystinuria type C protein
MIESAIDALAEVGFDLVHRFDASAAAHEPGLARIGHPQRRLGLLVGNTRELWPLFMAAIRSDAELAASEHPLELYTERALDRIAATIPGAKWWFGHREYGGMFLPFQRLAVATALGSLAPTRLVIHPTFGPWFALRAVIVCKGDPPTTRLTGNACTCGESCSAAYTTAETAAGPDAWRAWLAVRDACPIGRAFRYSDEQIAYHYTKDRAVLVSNTGHLSPSR